MAQLGLMELIKHIDQDRIIPAPNFIMFGVWVYDYYREIGLDKEKKPSKLIRSTAKNLKNKGAVELHEISRVRESNSSRSPVSVIESYGIKKNREFR